MIKINIPKNFYSLPENHQKIIKGDIEDALKTRIKLFKSVGNKN